MATKPLPKMRNRPGRLKKDVGDCGKGRKYLQGGIRYTSLRARNACFELGLPANQLPRIPSRERNVIKKRELTPPNDIVTSYLQALRLKKKRGKPAAATIVIGRYRSDYVTYTSQCSPSLLPIRLTETKRKMRKGDLKGILQQTKNCEASKRVTFNDEVTVEEFKPNSVIIQKVKNLENGGNDVTINSEANVSGDVNVNDNDAESKADPGKQGATGDERKDNETHIDGVIKPTNEGNHDETMTFTSTDGDFTNATKETRENNQQLITACKEPVNSANAPDLIPSKWPIVGEGLTTSDTRLKIGSQRAHLSIQKNNLLEEKEIVGAFVGGDRQLVKEITPSLAKSLRSDGRVETLHHSDQLKLTLSEQEVIENASEVRLIDSCEENEDLSFQMDSNLSQSLEENFPGQVSDRVLYKRRNLKKKYATVGNNLPIIREELNSRASNLSNVLRHDDVTSDVTKKAEDSPDKEQNFPRSGKLQSDSKTLLSRDDVIKKVRDDARLSALRGQIAADKAAWSCVVRYPRHVTSQPNSDRSSPLSPDVTYEVTRRQKTSCPLEKNNTFPLSGGEKLTLYRHNFGHKFRATSGLPATLPPLMTSRLPDTSLVTQRRTTVWVPDVSVVPKTKRHWVKTKGSHIVRYEAGK